MRGRSEAPPPDPTLRYAFVGGAFGAAFPLVATLLEIGLNGQPYTLGAALRVQAVEPLLWIIDTAPFVLATISGLIGKHQGQLRRLQLGRLQAEVDRFFHLSLDPLCLAGTDGLFRRVNPVWPPSATRSGAGRPSILRGDAAHKPRFVLLTFAGRRGTVPVVAIWGSRGTCSSPFFPRSCWMRSDRFSQTNRFPMAMRSP